MQQNYSNHRRYVKGYHFVLLPLLLIILISTVANLVQCMMACRAGACPRAGGCCLMYQGLLPVLAAISLIIITALMRGFANKVQDRAIHAEESLRYYMMTGKPMDTHLTWGQIIALRFAGDDEYLSLKERAIAEHMKPDDIKKAIRNWRADEQRC